MQDKQKFKYLKCIVLSIPDYEQNKLGFWDIWCSDQDVLFDLLF